VESRKALRKVEGQMVGMVWRNGRMAEWRNGGNGGTAERMAE
jgi:hypothetical protein